LNFTFLEGEYLLIVLDRLAIGSKKILGFKILRAGDSLEIVIKQLAKVFANFSLTNTRWTNQIKAIPSLRRANHLEDVIDGFRIINEFF
jgi:hypothetical protein